MMLDTPILRAISRLTHANGVKTTWPYDREIRSGAVGEDVWALALVRVGRTLVPVGVLRAIDDYAEENDLKFAGHEDDCEYREEGLPVPHDWIVAVRWR